MVKTKYDLIEEKSFKNMPYWVSELAENNFQRNREDRENREEALASNPPRIRLELTNKCNVQCTFCYRAHFKTNDHSVLTPEDVDLLNPVLATAKYISLFQKAESLMSPHIIPILDKMSQYDAVFYISTNGLLLDERISRALIRNKITFLTLSINAFNDNYERFYRGGNFETLEKNINRLNDLKYRLSSDYPRLRLSFVLRRDTLAYLDEALEFIKKHKFSEGIQIITFYSYVEEDRHLEPALDWSFYEGEMKRIREKAKNENILFEFSLDEAGDTRPSATEDYTKICYEPWESFNVTPSGNVYPCATASAPMGNIRITNPLDIWNSREFREFRKKMNGDEPNKDCAECWHCKYVAAEVMGLKASRLSKIYDSFYRRGTNKPENSALR